MHVTAQFFGGDGTIDFLYASDDQRQGRVEHVALDGTRAETFAGAYADAIGAFIDAAFGSLGPAVTSRVAAAKRDAIADIDALGAVATAAIAEAGIEMDQMVESITEAAGRLSGS